MYSFLVIQKVMVYTYSTRGTDHKKLGMVVPLLDFPLNSRRSSFPVTLNSHTRTSIRTIKVCTADWLALYIEKQNTTGSEAWEIQYKVRERVLGRPGRANASGGDSISLRLRRAIGAPERAATRPCRQAVPRPYLPGRLLLPSSAPSPRAAARCALPRPLLPSLPIFVSPIARRLFGSAASPLNYAISCFTNRECTTPTSLSLSDCGLVLWFNNCV
jgi:hypothetical protein